MIFDSLRHCAHANLIKTIAFIGIIVTISTTPLASWEGDTVTEPWAEKLDTVIAQSERLQLHKQH